MIYCLTGPSSSGKTSVLHNICLKKPEWKCMQEPSRVLWETTWNRKYKTLTELISSKDALQWQFEISNYMLDINKTFKSYCQPVILDSSPDSCIIFTMVYCINSQVKNLELLNNILDNCLKAKTFIFHSFYFEALKFIEDGFRLSSKRETERYLFSLFKHDTFVPLMTVEERRDLIIEKIMEMENNT